MNSTLPVCSVIRINNIKYIIIGKNVVVNDEKYDYCCVRYPFGFISDIESIAYFNDSEVDGVVLLGNINY